MSSRADGEVKLLTSHGEAMSKFNSLVQIRFHLLIIISLD